MNPNPVTLSRSLSLLSLSPGLQLQSLCLSQSLRRPATARPFSLSISHTSPSPSVSHLAVSFFLPFRVSTAKGDPRVRDGPTLLTLNLSHLTLAVSLSSRCELLLAVSSLDCKR
ncbi:uncharacterized protein LOC125478678 [Pyrus x bretschneideri]|uniref:uncharacterized protein LOC125478678 n=1 Tax=Pyrus x bretschneideri TaxID=225117 RepID=UPI00051099FE|nr:uncharacterized protein LOC125478678 [Pyrus x bretschneideri]